MMRTMLKTGLAFYFKILWHPFYIEISYCGEILTEKIDKEEEQDILIVAFVSISSFEQI